jgi:hypothetical protein
MKCYWIKNTCLGFRLLGDNRFTGRLVRVSILIPSPQRHFLTVTRRCFRESPSVHFVRKAIIDLMISYSHLGQQTSSKESPFVSGRKKYNNTVQMTPKPKNTKPTLPPKFPASGLIMYGVTKRMSQPETA